MSPDRTSDADLAAAARTILDEIYARELRSIRALFESRRSQGRATSDLSDAARAATFGAIEQMMVDIDDVVAGTVNEVDGRITFAEKVSAQTYGIVDEIAGRGVALGRERTRRAQGGYPGLRFARRDPAVSLLHPDIGKRSDRRTGVSS
jgi:hypothetical protein